MTLQRLKWLTLTAPLLYLAALLLAQRRLPDLLTWWPGYLLIAGVSLTATLFFNEAIFSVINRLQEQVVQRNRELLALHEAGLDIAEELDLATLLQRVVDRATALVGARYGALSLPRADGGGIEHFITAGITPEQRARIGPPPVGHGLLGVVLTEGQRLRLDDLTSHPRSEGFPPHHPPMRSLLAVPVVSRGQILGNLYLTEKEGATGFDRADEETLVRFATQAAVAIENARLHRLAREAAIAEERARLAREMHDSLAQVLGYVNTKAQAAQELLRAGKVDRASDQIGQLGQAAREAYVDVREHLLSLRTTLAADQGFLDALRQYLERWEEQSGVRAELQVTAADEVVRGLPPTAELQLLRIIQEALSNVRKHAGATAATVRLGAADGRLAVAIEDNGAGFDPAALGPSAFPRFGLTGMHERAEAVGGTLEIRSAPGEGTRVLVCLPLGGVRPALAPAAATATSTTSTTGDGR